MSIEDNKNVVRRFYEEVVNQGRPEVIDEVMDVSFHDHGEPPFGGHHGIEEVRQGVIGSATVLPGYHVEITDIVGEGDMVAVRGQMRGTHQGEIFGIPGTGKLLRWHGIAMYRIANGRIAEHWFNADELSIVQQMRGVADEVVW